MAKYLCGIDNGTTGTKAMVFDLDGNIMGEDYREYKCEFPVPGWVDQDAEMLFQSSCAALKSAIAKSGVDPKDIAAMGLSTQRCTMVPVDKDCRPLRKAISWQDSRATVECDWIRDVISAEKYYDITGLPIAAVWAFPTILWIRNNEPEIYEKTNKFLLTQEFILHRLGADGYPEDWSNGSLQGLMEIETFKWSQELINDAQLNSDQLPDLVPSAKMVGRITKEAAELTGLAEGTPLVTGGGDQQCAGIGAGVIADGLCEVTLGTAGVSLCFMDKPLKDPQMKMPCSAHAYPGKWECEGLQNAAGASYRWFRDTLANLEVALGQHSGIDPYELINNQVSKTPVGSRGLFYIPYLAGASAPNWDPYAKGSFVGLTLAHDYGCMARAVMEGISLETREILESFEGLGLELKEVRITGGGTKSTLWNQMQADIYGKPVSKLAIGEATVLGAAILGGVGAGVFNSVEEGVEQMVRIEAQYEPDNSNHLVYNEVFDIYRNIYHSMAQNGVYKQIADFQHNHRG
ncbi:MAG: xylulose kinase [Anaerolineae bacterium]|nr:xylulose kinase [Anaerolineae bacterium]